MSNKFLKILGICVLIVMLPVLIAVSAVCLTEDNANNNGGDTPAPTTPEVASYTVYSDYAENVQIEEKEGKWTLEKIPARNYYSLSGLKVNGNVYTLNAGVVEFAEGQEATFEKDVAENNPISTVWTCTFKSIGVVTAGVLAYDDVCTKDSFQKETNTVALEEIYVFGTLGYQFEQHGEITSVYATIDTNGNGTVDPTGDTTYEITFTAEDKVDQDVRLSTIYNKMVEQGATLTAGQNGYFEVVLAM